MATRGSGSREIGVQVQLSEAPPERCDAELVALAVTGEHLTLLRRERAAGPAILRALERQRFTAAEGTSVLFRAGMGGTRRHLVIAGLGGGRAGGASPGPGGSLGPDASAAPATGREGGAGLDAFRRAADQVVARARDAKARSAAVAIVEPRRHAAGQAREIAAFIESALLASYAFTEYRCDPERVPLQRLVVAGLAVPGDPGLRGAVRTAEILARATNQARTWINLPAAVLTPAALAAEAQRAGRTAGLEVRVDGPQAIARLGMRALLGVARGSAEEPRFIRLVYRPATSADRGGGSSGARRRAGGLRHATLRRAQGGAAAPGGPGPITLVGKGITFDSGGLSLKRPEGMEHMKRDMAGGAAVIAAMAAIAELGPAVEVRAYVPASENMPGGSAMKPGDVLRTAAGKTVEVLNTDAEGRLVLADALAVAVREGAGTIVDIATLTGAIRTALGTRVGGIMGNDPALVRALIAAGQQSGERLWELPLVRAYRADLDSPVADLRNVAADGHASSIHAALFLQEFVGGRPWAHLDVAGVAFTDRDLPATPRGGVGFGVRLLARYVLAAAEAGCGSERVK